MQLPAEWHTEGRNSSTLPEIVTCSIDDKLIIWQTLTFHLNVFVLATS